jgi:hypothetical protein
MAVLLLGIYTASCGDDDAASPPNRDAAIDSGERDAATDAAVRDGAVEESGSLQAFEATR